MRRLGLLAALLLIVGGLAACSVTVVFPVTPTPVSARNPSGSTSPVATPTLAPGGVRYYEIDVTPSQVATYDILQVELDQNLNLTLYGPDESTISSSSSPDYFASGTLGLASLAPSSGVAPQSITTSRTCAGSCVLQPLDQGPYSGAGTYYIKVENQTGTSQSVSIDAFVRPYDDSGEPQNNQPGGAMTLNFGSSGDTGAIETLGDQDWWYMNATATLTFQPNLPDYVRERADVYDSSGTTLLYTMLPGDTYNVQQGELVRVHALYNDRAGVSGSSGYTLTLQ